MRFLLDVCVSSRHFRNALMEEGHDVLSALEKNPRATDNELLSLAQEEQRVLITEDKDFGEWVFVHRLPHPCIVRFVEMAVEEMRVAILELIERHSDAMNEGSLIVVTRSRIRIRRTE